MSQLWLLPLGVGAGGALIVVLAVKRLNSRVAALKGSMRPLRVRTRRPVDRSGTF